MKLLFPVEVFYPSQAGGPANTVYWLTKNLKSRGFEPIVVASDKGLSKEVIRGRWKESDSGRLIYVKTRQLHVPIGQAAVALKQLIGADIVHLSSIFYPAAFLTAVAARLMRKKIAWSPRGELSEYSLNYSGKRKAPILWAIRKLVGNSVVFHSTSDDETADIKRQFGELVRIFQIPNYIEVEPEATVPKSKYLLYLGRFHPKKGIDELLRAAAISDAFRGSDMILKIAGRGKPEYEQELRDLSRDLGIGDKVEFVGHQEGKEKNELLAGAYFTFMPSHTENFGIVVLESLAQNTPVVASIHTPWEALEREGLGFWTDNSAEALAQIIDRILAMDEAEYSQYHGKCRNFVLTHFDIRNNMDPWLELYESLR